MINFLSAPTGRSVLCRVNASLRDFDGDVVLYSQTSNMMEMDHAMTSNFWHYSSYSQPLYQRYCYDQQHHHHAHGSHRYQTPDAVPSIFKSPQPYCGLNLSLIHI